MARNPRRARRIGPGSSAPNHDFQPPQRITRSMTRNRAARTGINALPPELKKIILESCELPAFAALRRTCTTFHHLSTSISRATLAQTTESALPCDSLACYSCCQLYRRCVFAEEERTAQKGRGGSEAHRRICLFCGLKEGVYKPGDIVNRWGGSRQYVCRTCRGFCGLFYTPGGVRCVPKKLRVRRGGGEGRYWEGRDYNEWVVMGRMGAVPRCEKVLVG
ncbi:MAG: hypothetical protein Q9184_008582 [Pyrenodesmia sp. 2 TL-2023]